MQAVETALTVALCVVAAVTDLRTGRIRNWLTLGAIGAGLVFALFDGTPLFLSRTLAAAVTLTIAIVLHSFGVLGGGDGKLFAAIAAWKGGAFTVEVAFWTAIVGGIVSIVVLARRGELGAFVSSLAAGAPAASSKSHLRLGPIVAIAVIVTVVTLSREFSFVGMLL